MLSLQIVFYKYYQVSTAIKIENVSKQYRLGVINTGTLSHDLNRWWTVNIRHKEDPYLKVGETNDRSTKGNSEYVWALKDINMEIEQGDVVGIIGKNGAGKSTLLKLLSRVTKPTTGTISYCGRIASLLEVGTGFHPEMTGRENIYMNGAIMGMSRDEVSRKLDEIVDFAGVERYLDTPVKRYSSGMTVRLGFAIAAHLEPEILVVDEVLAVGDAEFQKKAIGKMQDVSRGEGRTVLFVSHNMASVRSLCRNGVLLENGSVKFAGDVDSTINEYINSCEKIEQKELCSRFVNKTLPLAYITDVHFEDNNGKYIDTIQSGGDINLIVKYNSQLSRSSFINIGVYNILGEKLLRISSEYTSIVKEHDETENLIVFHLKKIPLVKGVYVFNFSLWNNYERIDWLKTGITLNVIEGDFYQTGKIPSIGESKFLIDYSVSV